MKSKNFFILCSLGASLINFRSDLIKDLVNNGYKVYCAAPKSSNEVKNKIENLGANFVNLDIDFHSLNPINFIYDYKRLLKKVKLINPDFFLAYTSKPVILLGLVSFSFKNSKFFPMITGLGYYFNNYKKKYLIKYILILLYKISCRKAKMFIFQNHDDHNEFKKLNIISKKSKTLVVNGSGVNLSKYKKYKKKISKKIIFVMTSRLLYQKGVKEFCLAAKIVKKKFPDVLFVHAGGFDNSPDRIKKSDFNKWQSYGHVKFLGQIKMSDVKQLLKKSDIFVLPSYYREGIPRSSMEALASCCAILTCNIPGCNKTVVNNYNGYSLPINNPIKLAEKMIYLISNPKILKKFQEMSYELSKNFDVKKINNSIIKKINNFNL